MIEQTIDLGDLREQVYLDGQDDYCGLYEIIWSLNAMYPDIPRPLKVTAAQHVIEGLLREKKISLFTTAGPASEYKQVPPDAALDAIAETSAWGEPGEGEYLCYAASG